MRRVSLEFRTAGGWPAVDRSAKNPLDRRVTIVALLAIVLDGIRDHALRIPHRSLCSVHDHAILYSLLPSHRLLLRLL